MTKEELAAISRVKSSHACFDYDGIEGGHYKTYDIGVVLNQLKSKEELLACVAEDLSELAVDIERTDGDETVLKLIKSTLTLLGYEEYI